MAQISWRAPDELADRVRHAARDHGWSVNEYVSRVLAAATDPDTAGDDGRAVRERLSHAGLLVPVGGTPRERPPARSVAAARRRAGTGTSAADLVSEGRR
ncbi:MAG: transcriptional regulator [Actinomycetes bacterium]